MMTWRPTSSISEIFAQGSAMFICIASPREAQRLSGRECLNSERFGHPLRLTDADGAALSGGVVHTDREGNEQLYGPGAEAAMIVGGRVRPPAQFNALYGELRALLEGEPLQGSRSRLLDTPQGARVPPPPPF